jgi:acetyl/propionyl-CoA carboxylase alpha subunit
MVDERREFYFLEVNTRLQVEHPVTEMVTGLDLVKAQIDIAEGKKLAYTQDDIKLNGHAIECRICAENPEDNFMPSTGKLKNYRIPAGPGIRVDSGVVIFSEVPIYYDPLIAKLIVWGKDRDEAIRRTRRALEEYRVSGVDTTIGFHRTIMDDQKFIKGDISTRFLEEEYPNHKYGQLTDDLRETAAIASALHTFVFTRRIKVSARPRDYRPGSRWSECHRRLNLRNFQGSR